MADWTAIPDSVLEVGKPIRSIDHFSLRDNITALAQAASGAPQIVLEALATKPVGYPLASGTLGSAQATLDFVLTSYLAARYDAFLWQMSMYPVNTSNQFVLRFSTNAGGAYDSGANYSWSLSNVAANVSQTSIQMHGSGETLSNSATGGGINAQVLLLNPANTARTGRVIWNSAYFDVISGEYRAAAGGGTWQTAQDIDAVRFLFGSGNINTSSRYALYGLTVD